MYYRDIFIKIKVNSYNFILQNATKIVKSASFSHFLVFDLTPKGKSLETHCIKGLSSLLSSLIQNCWSERLRDNI